MEEQLTEQSKAPSTAGPTNQPRLAGFGLIDLSACAERGSFHGLNVGMGSDVSCPENIHLYL